MSEPREWWICEPSDHDISEGVIYNYCVPADIAGKPVTMHPSIHVIEYAAFEEMQDLFIKENDRYRQALERIVNLKLQRAQPLEEEIARAALEGKSE